MSYDISYVVDSKIVELNKPLSLEGGIVALSESSQAWMNMTYNYSSILSKTLGEQGIKRLLGLKAKDVLPLLQAGIEKLCGNLPDDDYWAPTPGNVKAALQQLVIMSIYVLGEYPDATLVVE